MRLDVNYPIDNVKPAAYNPRAISADAIDRLVESIKRIGFVKPIIVRESGVIIAGHQRSKAARLAGLETVPAWVIDVEVSDDDEVTFNQFHSECWFMSS